MKVIAHTKGAQSWGLMPIVLAVLVGLMIVATVTGRQKPPSGYTPVDFERLNQVPVEADSEGSPTRVERPRPSPYDIWIDVRLLEAISRAA